MSSHFPKPIEELLKLLSNLPGVGRKTAERYVFDLVCNWTPQEKERLVTACAAILHLQQCIHCGVVAEGSVCNFCQDSRRDPSSICIVANAREAFAIEATNKFTGHYHVLQALISPLDRRGVEKLALQRLEPRLKEGKVTRVLLAVDSSVEGETTALYLKNFFQKYGIAIQRLAFGIPLNTSLEYIDTSTLAKAIERGVPF